MTVLIGNILCIVGMVSTVAGVGAGIKAALEAKERRKFEQTIRAGILTGQFNALAHPDS